MHLNPVCHDLPPGKILRTVTDLVSRKKAMKLKRFISISLVYLGLAFTNAAHAFDMGNMMNPSKWMGGNKDNDRDDDYYDESGYGYGGAPGYGGDPGHVLAAVVLPCLQ
jgi:hypothetical protein